jgi:hypothetical protein
MRYQTTTSPLGALTPSRPTFRIYSKPLQDVLSSMYICKALQKFKLNVYIFLHAHPKSGRIINELMVAAFW